MLTSLFLLATDTTDKTITVAVDGVRYEYWIRGDFSNVEFQFRRLLRAQAYGKALNLLKSNSRKVDYLGGWV